MRACINHLAFLKFCVLRVLCVPIFVVIPIQKINEAYERMIKNDVRYRFVIDMSTL
jgi:alcohol dehydrogenase (NADP+)